MNQPYEPHLGEAKGPAEETAPMHPDVPSPIPFAHVAGPPPTPPPVIVPAIPPQLPPRVMPTQMFQQAGERPLDYYGGPAPERPQPSISFAGQAVMGGLCYLGSLGAGFGIMTTSGSNAVPMGLWFIGLVNVFLCLLMDLRFNWRGFKVGVFITLPLSCLIGLGGLLVLCGGFGSK